ncbi:hypothetical protein [Flavobacterium turcicum]|uniref:Uncharacterized protein n=1 Tax=Flavobacterium turcicum TaxID=2764718 RepID=A0ABR7JHY0_9FLAO|nr:hypothetical protein [Flavobacterium turcicum]MBC5863754.1 hypothetical protein [Flavobacterium turcicum]NHL02298.1 hypothetical protein [Flavobacterium turcicum]
MKNFITVYDFAEKSLKIPLMLSPLIFVVIGIVTYYYSKNYSDPKKYTALGFNERKYKMIFSIMYASFATILATITISSQLHQYFMAKSFYELKKYKTVEGKVQNFHPMPAGGHDTERFDVNNIKFEYSDYNESDYGYNKSLVKGGLIKSNAFVKISYFNNGNKNVILKLQIEE